MTEFAIALPLLVMLVLGAVELSRGVMAQHALQEAANAGCRVYSVYGTSQQDARDIVEQSMANANISNYSIEFSPSTKAEIDEKMEVVSVTVRVEFEEVAWITPNFLTNSTVSGRCALPADLGNGLHDPNPSYSLNDDDNSSDGIYRHDDDDEDDD